MYISKEYQFSRIFRLQLGSFVMPILCVIALQHQHSNYLEQMYVSDENLLDENAEDKTGQVVVTVPSDLLEEKPSTCAREQKVHAPKQGMSQDRNR